jgi:THO complex subunit 1
VSEFNIENTTEFGSSEGNGDEPMGEPETTIAEDTMSLKVDKHLYLKFWELQEFFRCPYKCYDKEKFKVFSAYTKDVLSTFKSFKLEDTGTQDGKDDSQHFFAKFLTNPKLLSLQLGDSNFRRTILVQYLILAQYLVSTVKFKGENDKLTTQQDEWVREMETTVYTLLNETPPNGKAFANSIRHILKREELWNNWKNEGCKEITRPDGYDKSMPEPKRRKMAGDLIRDATNAGKFDLGNNELSRLWNLCPDNLLACKGSDRNFLPPLETYIEHKVKSDPTYEWRALRLVSRQSSHFFALLAPPNEKIEKISDYLKFFSQKIQKEKSDLKAENSGGVEIAETTEVLSEENENAETMEEINEDENEHKSTKATLEQIIEISQAIGEHWKKLGAKLGIENDILEYCVEKNEKLPCQHMLKGWFEEDEDGCLENLAYTLEGLEILDAVMVVKKFIDTEEEN